MPQEKLNPWGHGNEIVICGAFKKNGLEILWHFSHWEVGAVTSSFDIVLCDW